MVKWGPCTGATWAEGTSRSASSQHFLSLLGSVGDRLMAKVDCLDGDKGGGSGGWPDFPEGGGGSCGDPDLGVPQVPGVLCQMLLLTYWSQKMQTW